MTGIELLNIKQNKKFNSIDELFSMEDSLKGIEKIIYQKLQNLCTVNEVIKTGGIGSSKTGYHEQYAKIENYTLNLIGKKLYNVKEELKAKGYKWNGISWEFKTNDKQILINDIETYKKYLSDISLKNNFSITK